MACVASEANLPFAWIPIDLNYLFAHVCGYKRVLKELVACRITQLENLEKAFNIKCKVTYGGIS